MSQLKYLEELSKVTSEQDDVELYKNEIRYFSDSDEDNE